MSGIRWQTVLLAVVSVDSTLETGWLNNGMAEGIKSEALSELQPFDKHASVTAASFGRPGDRNG